MSTYSLMLKLCINRDNPDKRPFIHPCEPWQGLLPHLMRSRCLVADGRYPRLFSSSPGSLMSQFLSHLETFSIDWHFVFLICVISSLRMAFITESLFRSWREKDWLDDFSADHTSLCWWFTHYPLRLLTECFEPHRGCFLWVALLTQADLPVRVEHLQDGAEHGQTSSHRT